MKIKRSSIWYNLMIFPFSDHREWTIQNGCKFFWFTLFNVILMFGVFPIMCGFFLGLFVIVVIQSPWAVLLVLVGFGLFFCLIAGIFKISDSKLVKGFKEKHCPLIEYKNE